jgi:Lrp/AsnC family transcriptional regulator for asnA, asnC and gidA
LPISLISYEIQNKITGNYDIRNFQRPMDQIDLDIIAYLQSDGRKPFTDIAKELEISEGTVRNRVTRLVEKGVLQIVGLIDPNRLGYEAPAMIGVSVQPALLDEVAEIVADFPEVSYLIMVSGGFDLFVEVLCRDLDHLASFLSEKLLRVQGITDTQTFITLRTYKLAYGAVPNSRYSKRMQPIPSATYQDENR